MKILITGGTGNLGREVRKLAMSSGHDVRILSRKVPEFDHPFKVVIGDLTSGRGVLKAAWEADAIIHLASDPKRAAKVDVEGTRHLVRAAQDVRTPHLFYVSIVGVDEIPLPYYKRKLEAERIIEASGVPYSILRVTQFHSLVESMVSSLHFPGLLPLPTDFKFQSVAESEVAAEIMKQMASGPQGRLADFGGPEVLTLGEIAQTWQKKRGLQKRLISIPLPGRIAADFRAGKNTLHEGRQGAIRWKQWLEITRYPCTLSNR